MLDAKTFVEDCYTNYAKFVNNFRALPDSRDGLKLVQRRIISTLIREGNHGDLIASSAVVGDCTKWYHPHGDTSTYGATCNLVNDDNPVIFGKGNFGYRGLVSSSPAAYRYTKLAVNATAAQEIITLFKYTDFFINENDYDEPVFLPSAIPYCLLNGCIGIGIGCITNIPPIVKEDLRNAVKKILEGKTPNWVRPASVGGGNVIIDDENMKKLNTTGIATFKVTASIKKVFDVGFSHDVFEITDVPSYVNLTKLYVVFQNEIRDKLIFIRDECQKNERVIIGRTKRVRKITDTEILAKLQKICTRTITAKCFVSHHGSATIMTPLQMLECSVANAVAVNGKYVIDQVRKMTDKILFETVKHRLAEHLVKGTEDSVIKNNLGLTDEQFSSFTEKSISTLRSHVKDLEKMKADLVLLKDEQLSPKLSFAKRFGYAS